MPSERVIEIPWALMELPQSGYILDVGSCEAIYHNCIHHADRYLHCIDPRNCEEESSGSVVYYKQNILGNTLKPNFYDAVLVLSTIEHIGLPHYDQPTFYFGAHLVLPEIRRLLKPNGILIMTVPAGVSKIASWYRQYSPKDLHNLFSDWDAQYFYWGFNINKYISITEQEVDQYDYRGFGYGAGAIAGIKAKINLIN